MSMSRMMAQQVEQSEDTMTTLGELVSANLIIQQIWEEPEVQQHQVTFLKCKVQNDKAQTAPPMGQIQL